MVDENGNKEEYTVQSLQLKWLVVSAARVVMLYRY